MSVCGYKPCNNPSGTRTALDGCCSVSCKVRRDRAAVAKRAMQPGIVVTKPAHKPSDGCANPGCGAQLIGHGRMKYHNHECRSEHYAQMKKAATDAARAIANANRPFCASEGCGQRLPQIESGACRSYATTFCSPSCCVKTNNSLRRRRKQADRVPA